MCRNAFISTLSFNESTSKFVGNISQVISFVFCLCSCFLCWCSITPGFYSLFRNNVSFKTILYSYPWNARCMEGNNASNTAIYYTPPLFHFFFTQTAYYLPNILVLVRLINFNLFLCRNAFISTLSFNESTSKFVGNISQVISFVFCLCSCFLCWCSITPGFYSLFRNNVSFKTILYSYPWNARCMEGNNASNTAIYRQSCKYLKCWWIWVVLSVFIK